MTSATDNRTGHTEIVEFCRFLEPTDEETAARGAATERVAQVIKAIWPGAVVQVFGSFATGLFLPTSDMDLVVTDSGEEPPLPSSLFPPPPPPHTHRTHQTSHRTLITIIMLYFLFTHRSHTSNIFMLVFECPDIHVDWSCSSACICIRQCQVES